MNEEQKKEAKLHITLCGPTGFSNEELNAIFDGEVPEFKKSIEKHSAYDIENGLVELEKIKRCFSVQPK
jgi:hypothetical protein